MIWCVIVLGSLALLALSGFLIYLAGKTGKEYNDANKLLPENQRDVGARNNKNLLLAFCVLSCLFTAIFMCIVCGLRKKIHTSIEVLEETSKALSQQPSTFAVPVCTLIFQLAMMAVWAVTAAYIVSASDTLPVKPEQCSPIQSYPILSDLQCETAQGHWRGGV